MTSGQSSLPTRMSSRYRSQSGCSTPRRLLGDQDLDSHTPLLMEVHANQFTGGRIKAMNRNPDTVQEAAARRKERQQMNKLRGSTSDPTADAPQGAGFPQGKGASGATSSGSQRPPEPAQPHGGKTEGSKGGKSSKGKESKKGQVQGQVQRQEQGEELTRF